MLIPVAFVILCGVLSNDALENGMALTPPMGWLSWLKFGCTIDCDAKPTECISENLIKRTADMMVSEGYLAAGYQYITIDDCWLEHSRGPDGRLVPDRKRFPSGMKALAEYVHSKGLKFGMYQDYGSATCEGYPGVEGYEKIDAETLASWDIDYLKLDGCHTDVVHMSEAYPAFGQLLNATGRPILYACSWPFFQEVNNIKPNYFEVAQHCNIWRNWYDIRNSWQSVMNTITWLGDNQEHLAPFAGPGHWNDPDMLVVGNSGLTRDQAQAQMALWSILAAPLMMSLDLATIQPEFKEILLNREVINVNQDKLGKQGLRVWKSENPDDLARRDLEVWKRKLSNGCFAVAFLNRGDEEVNVSFSLEEIHLPKHKYILRDLYQSEEEIPLQLNESISLQIKETSVKFYKFIPYVRV